MNSDIWQQAGRVTSFQSYSREELEQRLLELTDFVENASLPLHWVDRKGVIVWANQAELDLLGYPADEYIGRPIIDFHADQVVINEILTRLINNETLINFPARLRCKDGSLRHVLINSNVFVKNGEFIHTRCFTRDVTLIKQAEEKSARLAAIVESSADAIVSKTLDGIITSWNKSAEKMFGYTEMEILGKSITILIPENRLHEEKYIIEKISQGKRVEHFETYRITKENVQIPVSLTISPIKNSDGFIIGASKIARDISLQKASEEKLQRYADNLEILNTISKRIADLVRIDEILQEIVNVSVSVTKAGFGAFLYFGNEQKEVAVNRAKFSGADSDVFQRFFRSHESYFNRFLIPSESISIFKSNEEAGSKEWLALCRGIKTELPFLFYVLVPVVSKSGLVIGGLIYGFINEYSPLAEVEALLTSVAGQSSAALEKAELYEEIRTLNTKKDEFIGLASHELKTPVTSLQGYLQIVHQALPVSDRNKDFIQRALKQAGKLTRLISDLLDVSKIENGQLPLSFTDFNLIPFLTDLIDLLQYTTKTHRIVLHTDIKQLRISADKNRLEQVITNLISNAIKYSPKSDLVNVFLSSVEVDIIRISVQDFGIGIKKEHQEKVFSRFYRVEELAGHMSGLGLGLFISKEIISRHNGNLYVDSVPGKGSTFSIDLSAVSVYR